MRTPTQTDELLASIASIRSNTKHSITNLFAPREQMQQWTDRGALSVWETGRGLLVLRRERDLHRLYHVAADAAELALLLEGFSATGPATEIVVDLVGTCQQNEAVAGVYRAHGFSDYAKLLRMRRLPSREFPCRQQGDSSAGFASPDDLEIIFAFLGRILDRFRDQIPDADEMREAIYRHRVLVERSNGAIGGLLLFEDTGVTSLLRYWYVDPDWCNRGIGGRLMRAYLGLCRKQRRNLVWVVRDNASAIAKYRHYGFEDDKLTDQILLRRSTLG
jgi:GNAT superfamily N-acetyltransferase